MHGLEVSSLHFVKVLICVSHEFSRYKRRGCHRFLRLVRVVSPSSLHPVVLGSVQLLEFFWCVFKE